MTQIMNFIIARWPMMRAAIDVLIVGRICSVGWGGLIDCLVDMLGGVRMIILSMSVSVMYIRA